MSARAAGLLDTSVFIAREDGSELGELPDRVAISVVTIGELQLGVLSAADDGVRARRATPCLGASDRSDPDFRGGGGRLGAARRRLQRGCHRARSS